MPALPWVGLALALACGAAGLILGLGLRTTPESGVGTVVIVFPLLGLVPFAVTGALVASKKPKNAIGWLLLLTGCLIASSFVGDMVASYDIAHPGAVPGGAQIAWFAANLWLLTLVSIPFLLTRFPDGRPVSRRWRTLDVVAAALVLDVLFVSLKPGPLPDYPKIENPFGMTAVSRASSLLEAVGFALFLSYLVLAATSVVVRYRRSRGVERLQLKWLAFTVSVTALAWILGVPFDSGWLGDLAWSLGFVGFCCIPVSIGIAVLRYQLYDIDRLISRTLVYALVTVLLGAAYVGLVLAGQAVFSSFAGGSNLAIAISTLVVAALFLPVRTRVQALVDRRFYRRRYDAVRTLEAFGARLRDELDLESLSAEMVGVITDTMQPAAVSLWLREVE